MSGSGDSQRSDESAPSLSSYPTAFVSLISTFIKRAEDAETRAHKALVILKNKDSQVADLQQRMESLQTIASRSKENVVPPLELQHSSSSSSDLGNGSPHPRQLEAIESRLQSDDPPLETLYEGNRKPTTPEKTTEDPADCYAMCQKLLAEMQRSDQYPLEETRTQRAENQIVSKTSKDQLPSLNDLRSEDQLLPSLKDLRSDMNIDALNKLPLCGSNNPCDMVVINKEEVKENLHLAKSIIDSLQSRLVDENRSCLERNVLAASSSLRFKSSRSSVSSYHTPKSKISSRFLIRRRKTTHCYFSSLNREHKKLRMKYHHVYEKFKESLALCGKLQDDIVNLTGNRRGNREDKVEMLDKQTQTQFSTRGSSSLLQGRLDAASQAMRRRLVELQELRTHLDEMQSTVTSLKKRLSRAEADAAMKEEQLAEAAATNAAQSMQLQHLKLQLSEMSETRQSIDSQEESYRKELEYVKKSMEMKIASLEALVEAKDSTGAQVIGDLECKLKHLKGQIMLHIVEATQRLSAADAKIQQLYLAIQTFLKTVFGLWRDSYRESNYARGRSDVELQAMRVASEILQLPPAQLNNILQPSTNVNKWLRKCRKLVFEEEFGERLGCLLVDAVCEARHS